jgi:ribose 5-phosphate isomerase A
MENLKKLAGNKAAEYIQNGMIVGLGTGSTAKYFVEEVGRRVREEGLQIVGVTTSAVTSAQARALGISLKSINEVDYIDLTVDGADEIDTKLNGIKGGGAALLMEKIVATYSKDYIWIVDESKLSETLGSFKLPVEVVPYGADRLFSVFEQKGYRPSFRLKAGQRLLTDMQHYIIDLHMSQINDPQALAQKLDATVGVVEHGLFNAMVQTVIIGTAEGVKVLKRSNLN